jgi:transcriptional regulator with XRE-family HTH domain
MDVVHDVAVTGRVITRAVGDELRRVRNSVGWTRDELVERIPSEIAARTIATYEHGTRQCTIARFVEICETLGVTASAVLGLAEQRAELHLETIGFQVDLDSVVAETGTELKQLRRWASNRIAADPNGPKIARLTAPVVQEMAVFFGFTRSELIRHLLRFTPESAPRY